MLAKAMEVRCRAPRTARYAPMPSTEGIGAYLPKKYFNLKKSDKIKVLAKGELKGKLNIAAHEFSDKAKEAIEKTGGATTIIA